MQIEWRDHYNEIVSYDKGMNKVDQEFKEVWDAIHEEVQGEPDERLKWYAKEMFSLGWNRHIDYMYKCFFIGFLIICFLFMLICAGMFPPKMLKWIRILVALVKT